VVAVAIGFADGLVTVEIVDDGRGVDPGAARASGTANLARRADAWGGAFALEPGSPTGTVLRWTAHVEGAE